MGEEEFRKKCEKAGIDPEKTLESYVAIPKNDDERTLVEILTEEAVLKAMERHAGYIRYIYGPSGRSTVAEGKDLTQVKELVDQADEQGIYDLFDTSRNYRNSFPSASAGPIKKSFAVYCDIIDEAGGIAAIATILASNNLNLKNIGIVHNREFEEGVLRIEFYDEASSRRAAELLQKFRYIVYER